MMADIGIIGGADGPTAVMVAGSHGFLIMIAAAAFLAALIITAVIVTRKNKK